MPRKPSRPLDPVQSAVSMLASVIASDEEFAAGVHLKNPEAILRGSNKLRGNKSKLSPKKR